MPDSTLPAVLAGPLLRRPQADRINLWLVTCAPVELTLELAIDGQPEYTLALAEHTRTLAIGRHAWLRLVSVPVAQPLPYDTLIAYDLLVGGVPMARWGAHLLYEREQRAHFVLRERLDYVLHGSCRKPHHPSDDGLRCADRLLAARPAPHERPALLIHSGDQVYADDVAGPMLGAIHALVQRLGLFDEPLEGAVVEHSQALYGHPASYYRRAGLLPDCASNRSLRERFFGGARKPIFTSSNAENHLVTFAEVMAMYLLVWSPTPWTLVTVQQPVLEHPQAQRWADEAARLKHFRQQLAPVARVLAHLPSLMIFDDHDITDDWNLTAQWEQTAYGHPFSRRIIGNALIGYLLCQGWGNQPAVCEALLDGAQALCDAARTPGGWLPREAHDAFINQLLRWNRWGFGLDSQPPLLVLDTRTQRWRSEDNLARPSGLMDWEALCEVQQFLLDHPACVLVSPAPMFGVKLIETVQRVFSAAGQALMVDAENWMAHKGAARTLLSIFKHSRTPGCYTVLSGDVHYSFVYHVRLRQRAGGTQLWQVTSSGIKNEFPERLLNGFDRLNRWLFAPRSPLNLFTRRRDMQVTPYLPDSRQAGERLHNGAGLGWVRFDAQGRPTEMGQLDAHGRAQTRFLPPNDGLR